MDLNEQLNIITKNIEEISNSSLPEGTKNDILGTLNGLQNEIEQIKPLYDNIDSVKKLIIEPTNIKIAESFENYENKNKKIDRRNSWFSVTSLLFGILGIVLTIIPIVKTGLKQNIIYSVNDIDKIFSDFEWTRRINYEYEKNILNCLKFKLTINNYDNTVKLDIDIRERFLNIKELTDQEQLIIKQQIENIYSNYYGVDITLTQLKYQGRYSGHELLFSKPAKYNKMFDIDYKVGDLGIIIFEDSYNYYYENNYNEINYGNNPQECINTISQLIYLLSGKKYKISISDTVNNKYIMNYYQDYNKVIILKEY